MRRCYCFSWNDQGNSLIGWIVILTLSCLSSSIVSGSTDVISSLLLFFVPAAGGGTDATATAGVGDMIMAVDDAVDASGEGVGLLVNMVTSFSTLFAGDCGAGWSKASFSFSFSFSFNFLIFSILRLGFSWANWRSRHNPSTDQSQSRLGGGTNDIDQKERMDQTRFVWDVCAYDNLLQWLLPSVKYGLESTRVE